MARANHCKHGTYINRTPQESVEIELNGVKQMLTPPQIKCWQCELEIEQQKQAEKLREEQEIALVKRNILLLLQNDENFREEIKNLLNGNNSSNNEKKDITNYV
jgi:hypothetical protein